MKIALIATLFALFTAVTATPLLADDRFDRPGRWEPDRRYLYDYDPRSPYPQHRVYPPSRQVVPILPRNQARDWHLERRDRHWQDRRWNGHRDGRGMHRRSPYDSYGRGYRDHDRRYQGSTPRGFYYGPGHSYPSSPSFRIYLQ